MMMSGRAYRPFSRSTENSSVTCQMFFFRVFPVDEVQVKGLFAAIEELLFIGAAEQKSVIDGLGGGQQSVLQRNIQILDRLADGTVGKGGDLTPVSEILGAQKAPQFVFEKDLAQMLAFVLRLRRGNINIPHGTQLINRPILRLRPLIEYRVVKHVIPPFATATDIFFLIDTFYI